MGDLRSSIAASVPMQNAARQDPVEFFHEYATMLKYQQIALERKLDEQSPTKEILAFSRLYNLSVALVQDAIATLRGIRTRLSTIMARTRKLQTGQGQGHLYSFADAPSAEDKSLTEEQARPKPTNWSPSQRRRRFRETGQGELGGRSSKAKTATSERSPPPIPCPMPSARRFSRRRWARSPTPCGSLTASTFQSAS